MAMAGTKLNTHENNSDPNFDPHTHGRSSPREAALSLGVAQELYVRPKLPSDIATRDYTRAGVTGWKDRWRELTGSNVGG